MKRPIIAVALLLALGCASVPIQPDPIYRETVIRHARPRLDGERFDPQEDNPALAEAFASADKKAERSVGNVARDADFVFHFWKAKKRILQEEFGISWKSPADLNPWISYSNYGQPKINDAEFASIKAFVQANLLGRGERVVGASRMFDGDVIAVTFEPDSGIVRHYHLLGHDQKWALVSVGIFEE